MSFHDLGLNRAILRTLEAVGLTVPTPIQTQAIPPVLEGRDVLGLAQTGTGKTAAFLLPLLQRQIRDQHKGKYRPLRVLILSPTRELATQIHEKAREYGKSLNLRSQCAVGGIPINRQQRSLANGTDILIATPGRLLDLKKRNFITFDDIQSIVLDEADHMLDIGFLPDIKRIFAQLPAQRQTLLFSATMPPPIHELAEQYLKEPVEISVAREASVAENIDQLVKHVTARQKPDELANLLQQFQGERVMVFARTKHGSDKIVKRLQAQRMEAAAIHGNKSQGQRERALKAFAKGECNVLVATDIAARGIDVKDVGVVINYELPSVPQVYVHRIGRTARAGTSGTAIAFCAPDEVKHLRSIEKLIKMEIPHEGDVIEPESEAGKAANKRRGRIRRKSSSPAAQKNRARTKAAAQNQDAVTDDRPAEAKTGPAKTSRSTPKRNAKSAKPSGPRRKKPRKPFRKSRAKPA